MESNAGRKQRDGRQAGATKKHTRTTYREKRQSNRNAQPNRGERCRPNAKKRERIQRHAIAAIYGQQ